MRILSGIDIADISRIEKSIDRQGDAFINKVFTLEERAYCDSLSGKRRIESYAARFAAKEAAAKALGTGIMAHGVVFTDFEVRKEGKDAPELVLSGKAAEIADLMGVFDISVSLSHDGGYAAAVCNMLAEGNGDPS